MKLAFVITGKTATGKDSLAIALGDGKYCEIFEATSRRAILEHIENGVSVFIVHTGVIVDALVRELIGLHFDSVQIVETLGFSILYKSRKS